MKKITELLESYSQGKLKALSRMFVEEPTEDEFNKEVEEVKEKGKGKIRNKKIGDPVPSCCESDLKKMDELEEEVKNRPMWSEPKKGYLDDAKGGKPMTPEEKAKRHEELKRVAKDIKSKRYTTKGGKVVEEEISIKEDIDKPSNSFKNLYGDRSKMVEEEFDFQEISEESLTEEFINEWNASGHKQSKALKWIKSNGFEPDRHSKHPAYKHVSTGKTVTAFNTHGNEVGAEALRNTRKMIIQHHQENGIKYKEL